MPFTIEEFRDLIRVLEERPEWRAELRRLVLTDELLTLPGLVRELAEAQQRTELRVAELAEAQQRTEGRLSLVEAALAALAEAQRRTEAELAELTRALRTLTIDVGDLKGYVLERRYREQAPAYFGRILRRARTVPVEELDDLLERARAQGQLSEREAEQVTWADLIVRGRRREDDGEVYLVVEVSWGVGSHDVERAEERAALLARSGVRTLPAVAGKTVTDEAASLARALKVWQFIDGRAVPPAQS